MTIAETLASWSVAPLHFRRIELKYVIDNHRIPTFLDAIAPYTQDDPFLVAEGKGRSRYPVTSLYFDSMDLQSLHEKESGILARRKLRLRTYNNTFTESESCFLEIKRRHDFIVSKDRLSLSLKGIDGSMSRLLSSLLDRVEASQEVCNEAQMLAGWYNLQPTAVVSYQRRPFVGLQDRRFRITIDSDLSGSWQPTDLFADPMLMRCHPEKSVVEIKCNNAIPAWFHDIMREFEFWRVAHSKYMLVVSDLRPDLHS